MNDLQTKQDLCRLVDGFYQRVRADDLLAPIFAARIPAAHWPGHLDTITRFWAAAVLGQPAGYRGNPGARHLGLPIGARHFARWLALFGQTVDELFAGDKAEEIKLRAARMGELFQLKIALARAGTSTPIL